MGDRKRRFSVAAVDRIQCDSRELAVRESQRHVQSLYRARYGKAVRSRLCTTAAATCSPGLLKQDQCRPRGCVNTPSPYPGWSSYEATSPGFVFLWPPYVIGQAIIFFALWFLSSVFYFFPRLISAATEWMSTILLCMVWAPSDNFVRLYLRN